MTLTDPNAALRWAWPVIVLAMPLLSGCGGGFPKRGAPTPSGTTAIVRGEWDDLDAAIEAMCGTTELALVGRVAFQLQPAEVADLSTRRRGYDLLTSADEPARITFAAQETGEPTAMVMTVRVGRFGDASREAAVIEAVRRRLADLEGKDFAPMRR